MTIERLPVMADVARLAGVSHQTVSRVVNGRTNLRPETRDRVLRAIEQLGYRPNTAARSLVTRRSGTIGVIGSRSGFWGPSTVHRAIQSAGRDAGFFVSSVNVPALRRDDVVGAMEHLRDQHVEGIVLIAATDDAVDAVRARADRGVPVVVVEGDAARAEWTVGVDQAAGAEAATRHLIELGHRRILHLAGPSSWTEARARSAGYRRAMDVAGLLAPGTVDGDWSARSGFEAGARVAAAHDVTAVFCANDQMALGLLRALSEAGRRVPDDVSVVGFDDIPEAAYLIPPLTTVRQDFDAVGRRAIEILRAAMGEGPAPERLIPAELVVRASSGAVPCHDVAAPGPAPSPAPAQPTRKATP